MPLRPLRLVEDLARKSEKQDRAPFTERKLVSLEAKDTVSFQPKPLNLVKKETFLKEIRAFIKEGQGLKETTKELLKDTSDFLKALHGDEMDINKIKQFVLKYPELLTRLHKKDVFFGRIKGQDILKQLSLQKDSLKELTEDGSQTVKEQLKKQGEAYQQEREEEWLKMSHMPGGWRDDDLADVAKKEELGMETDNLVEPVVSESWDEKWLTTPVAESEKSNVPVMQVSSQKLFGGLCASFLSLPKLVSWDKMCCGGK